VIIVRLLNKLFPPESARRLFASFVKAHPVSGSLAVLRSLYCNYVLTRRLYPIKCFVGPRVRLQIHRHRSASVILDGKLFVSSWDGGREDSRISLGEGAKLEVGGDFELGHGVRISISKNANLYIGGKQDESASGITCNTMIMVEHSMTIGKDCIIAWDCYLTDSDWHNIYYQDKVIVRSIPVSIGDHVWIGHGCSILKGAVIGDGSIIASKSNVLKGSTEDRALLAGSPAKPIKFDVDWRR
jgi:acetyltransferase-like isoleucine patch superfamily enzyme